MSTVPSAPTEPSPSPGRWSRVGGGARRLLRTGWTLPVGAAAVGWVLRETVPFGGSPGGDLAALLGVVAPTSLTFPCWLHGAPSLRRLRLPLRRRPAPTPTPP